MFRGALALIIFLPVQTIGLWYVSRRTFAVKDEAELLRWSRQAASFSLAVGCAILALGVAGLVVLKFTLDGWLTLLLAWSSGLLHIGLLALSWRRVRRRVRHDSRPSSCGHNAT